MKRLTTNLLLIFGLFTVPVHADITGNMIRGFLSSFQVNTTTLPKVYVSWNSPLFGEKFCKSIDFSRWAEAPREKMDLYSYLFDKLIPFFGSPPLTPEEETANCYGGAIINPWKVKLNGSLDDRPTYDKEKFLADGSWVQNGRVAINTVCDIATVRKTVGYSYHTVINTKGIPSLTACVQ
jgi:hypothetical protein